MQAFKYPGLVDCVKRTYAAEGLLGFYRGVLPVLASTSLLRSISFSIYTSGKLGLLAETNDPSSFIHLPGLSDFQRTAVAA